MSPRSTAPLATPRRRVLGAAGGLALLLVARPAGAADAVPTLAAMVLQWAGGKPVGEGRVRLEIPTLVENGNAVPIRIGVDSPMTAADHVQEVVVYNERNPWREVARFVFGPAAGRAQADARMRLATSQRVVALARLSDGSLWSHQVDVIVTLAACVEE